jgi:hypothetical protein
MTPFNSSDAPARERALDHRAAGRRCGAVSPSAATPRHRRMVDLDNGCVLGDLMALLPNITGLVLAFGMALRRR